MRYFFLGFIVGLFAFIFFCLIYRWLVNSVLPFMRAFKKWNEERHEKEIKLPDGTKAYIKSYKDEIENGLKTNCNKLTATVNKNDYQEKTGKKEYHNGFCDGVTLAMMVAAITVFVANMVGQALM